MNAPDHGATGTCRRAAADGSAERVRRWVRRSALVGSAAAAYMLFESQWLKTSEQRLAVSALPPSLEGRTILHLSDVHAGQPGLNLWTFARAVRWAEQSRPDLIVLTGDILGGRRGLTRCLKLLARLRAPFGVYAVPGNHEYGISKNPLTHTPEPIPWESAGVKLLRDTCVAVDVPPVSATPGAPLARSCTLTICGADYVSGGRPLLETPVPATDTTASTMPVSTTDTFSILLIHRPPAADDPLASLFQLAFAGHTHGGQIRMPTPRGLRSPHDEGFSQLEGVHTWGRGDLVISAGIGTTFLPFRLFTRPQAVVYRLVAADGASVDGHAPKHAAEPPGTRPSGIREDVDGHMDGGGGADVNG